MTEVGDMPQQAEQTATVAELNVLAEAPVDRPGAGSTPTADGLMDEVGPPRDGLPGPSGRAGKPVPQTAAEPTALLALARERQEQGDAAEAERLYRQAINLLPDAAEVHNALGILLAQQGRAAESEACFRQVTRLVPESAQAHSNLGNVQRQLGLLAEAEASQRRAIDLQPDSALGHNNLGLVLAAQGRLADAEACYRSAVLLQANFSVAHDNLGNVLRDQGRLPESEASHRAALQFEPNSARLHIHLGLTLAAMDRLAEAEACYRQAIDLTANRNPKLAGEAHHNLGNVFIKQGKLDEAEACFRHALQFNPHHAEACYDLANTLKDQRKFDEAEGYYRQTLLLKPNQPEVHNNLGIALMDQGKLEEAEASYAQALRLKPDFAATYINLGIVMMRLDRVDEAVAHLRQALRLQPGHAGAHNNLGVALQKQGKQEEAIASFRKALHFHPDFVEAYNNLGNIHKERGEKAEAEASFKESVRLRPGDCDARNHFAIFLMDQGKLDEALAQFTEAIRIRPDFPEALNNIGLALQKVNKFDEAEAALRRAIGLRENFYEAINNLGNVVKEQGKPAEAIECYKESVRIKPDFAGGHSNLGIMYFQEGQLSEASACYERALEIQPEYADARWNRSLLWLMDGDFARGWPEYEWRWLRPECPQRVLAMPRWQGEDLTGRTIFLHAEQGLGDTLHFIRYAPMVKQRGGTVAVECQPLLTRLFGHCPGIDRVIAQGDAMPAHDVQAALLSLPHLLGTDCLENIPAQVPYIEPPRDLIEHWRARLAAVPGFRIGITWQGNPGHKGDRWRSVPLTMFAPLAKIAGVSLVSLQKGAGSEQIADIQAKFEVLDLGAEFVDMADTAAALKSLDLVVTIDSAVAHLAGALAVPVWVALPHASDWRWLLQRPDSPWYPTMRLFRQPGWNQWEAVFDSMANEIAKQLSVASRPDWQSGLQPSPTTGTEGLATLFAEAVELHKAGHHAKAEPIYRHIVQDNPGHAQAWHFLGLIAHEDGRNEEAIGHLNRAIALEPEYADAHNNLGIALQRQGKLPQAEASLRRALALKPEFPEAQNNLGGVLKDLGNVEGSLAAYQQALRLNADDADAHWNLALLQLLMGDFEHGWTEFEWRLRRSNSFPCGNLSQPRWQGDDLAGRTILLHAEAGRGDTIQFARYAALVKQRGGKVILACHPPLKSLLSRCSGVDQVLAWDEPLPPFDVYAPLLSLPALLGTTALDRIPGNVPYLEADPQRVQHWRGRPDWQSGLRVGIAWQGNPQFKDDRWRSVPLTRFEALARVPGVKLISLQKGFGAEQLKDVARHWGIVDFGPDLDADGAFRDTAAIIKNLDLVVTTDTALAHLAGAMGVPVWVALPFVPDWRWLLDRHDSPWYPSMRLFRQPGPGQWKPVFERIADEMSKLRRLSSVISPSSGPRTTDNGKPTAFDLALRHHQAGDLRQAEKFYRQVRSQSPRHPEALHYLGLIVFQDGRVDEAVASISQALALRPATASWEADAYSNLGVALQKQQKLTEAADSLRHALRLNPDLVAAHNNLGNVLKEQGLLDEALASYQTALRLQPGDAEVYYNLGIVLHDQKKPEEAEASYREALRLIPNYMDAHIRMGHLLAEQGKHKEAVVHYREVLRINPDFAEIEKLLEKSLKESAKLDAAEAAERKDVGRIANPSLFSEAIRRHQAGNLADAEKLYRQILHDQPGHAAAHRNLGHVLREQRKFAEALDSFRASLRFEPGHVEGHMGLGVLFLHEGRPQEAEDCFRRAVRLSPQRESPAIQSENAAAHNNLGVALQKQRKLTEAADSLRQALRLHPDFTEAHNNLGNVLKDQGRFDEALTSYQAAMRLKPGDAELHYNMGIVLHDQAASSNSAVRIAKLDQAANCYREALRLAANSSDAKLAVDIHIRLGNALADQGLLEESVVQFRQALGIKPDYAECWINLGNSFKELGRLDEAQASYREAERLRPDLVEAHTSMGNAFLQAGQIDEAEASYLRGLRMQPDHPDANWNLALVRLLRGNFERGWEGYEWRWQRTGHAPEFVCPQPQWQGESLAGRTILLHAEQGLGDTIQFIRYAKLIGSGTAFPDRPDGLVSPSHKTTVLLACHEPLVRLLNHCPGVDRVAAFGEPLPPFDTHVPLLSLPRLLGTNSLQRIPADIPYLEADPELTRLWRDWLGSPSPHPLPLRGGEGRVRGSNSRLKIGIAWRGNPAFTGDRWRSAPLDCFTALAGISGVTLVSLQVGPGGEQLKNMPGLALDVGPHITDLADTAAAMMSLDLVITVDSVLAHLAGAIGVPVWVALPFAADWRWLLHRPDSPWYPTARLFRQTSQGDWPGVFARITEQAKRAAAGDGK